MVIAAQRSLVSCTAVSYVVKHFCLISFGFCEHVAGIVPEGRDEGNHYRPQTIMPPQSCFMYPGRKYVWFPFAVGCNVMPVFLRRRVMGSLSLSLLPLLSVISRLSLLSLICLLSLSLSSSSDLRWLSLSPHASTRNFAVLY